MTSIITNPRERTRFVRFAIVGTVGAVVDFTTFNILRHLQVNLQVSGAIAFTVAVLSNFTWNRYWTYPDSRSKKLARQLAEFFVINLIGLGIRTLVLTWLSSPLGEMFATLGIGLPVSSAQVGENLALAIAVVIVMFWNFFANRYWTYGDVD